MENASKALLIAGGILISILILTLLVYTATTTSRFAKTQDEKKQTEKTVAFNREYEAYNKKRLYGTEVITVVNKAEDYNKMVDTTDANYYKINISIKDNGDEPIDEPSVEMLKGKYFQCTGIGYSQKTGRVNSMTFQQID